MPSWLRTQFWAAAAAPAPATMLAAGLAAGPAAGPVSARDAADSGEQIQTTVTTFDVTVTAVNDAPVISHQRSTPFVMAEGTTLRIQPLSVTDVDVGESKFARSERHSMESCENKQL